jgi:uncharacterized protein YndB with AHSA1/START domain
LAGCARPAHTIAGDVRQVTVAATISAPREQIYDFVADLAARPAYTDHYLEDYRLARANPVGKGAAARFKIRGQYAELSIRDADRPRRIVEELRVGRRGRNRAIAVYDFIPEAAGTRVELTTYGEPATPIDRMRELGLAGFVRRNSKKALDRLRMIFEDPPDGTLTRVSVAGFEPQKSARFGAATGMDPSRPAGGRGA